MVLLLGLDIGGTKSAAVIGDADGMVFARVSALTPQESWQEAYALLLRLISKVCQTQSIILADITAVGVSCGGPVDTRTGTVYAPPNLPAWDSVPLRSLLEADLGLSVALENDANATALAEYRWGAGQGCRDMAFLTMGTGIGAGLILDGALYRGRRDLAGEIGHATVLPAGPLCLCGKRGCLEALASGTAIGRMGGEHFGEYGLTAHDVCARARLGDSVALSIIADAALYMGIGLANLLHTLNLERIVLGTLAVHAADLLMEPIRAATQAYCWPRVWNVFLSFLLPSEMPLRTKPLLRLLSCRVTEVTRRERGAGNHREETRVFMPKEFTQREDVTETHNIVLIGFMGTGKSAVGRVLARRTQFRHLDTDGEIERAAGKTIPQIFADEGEAAFRARETAFLSSLIASGPQDRPLILSTGGGTPLREENAVLLKQIGTVVWLQVAPEAILSRVAHSLHERPLLSDYHADPLGRIQSLLTVREPHYAALADFVLETSDCADSEEGALRLMDRLSISSSL